MLLAVSLFHLEAHGQRLMMFKGNYSPNMQAAVIRDSTIIDTAQLSLAYRFTRTCEQATDSERWCRIAVQVGRKVVKQQDLLRLYSHLLYTKRKRDDRLEAALKANGNSGSDLFSELYLDTATDSLTVVCGDWFDFDRMKDYRQARPALEWRLHDERTDICGYACHKATAEYGGRSWTVWYAPDIPLPVGPWKLSGLPGAILRATDGGLFTFDCVAISRDSAPIVRYRYNSLQHLKSREAYLRYERSCHEHPYETFARGEKAYIVTTDAAGRLVYLDETWTIPYNPIELE